jgi:phospho-N-acetylmuramoyl-pentapeptide-transferase
MIALLIAGVVSMTVSLAGTRYLIGFFSDRGKSQPILGKEDRGPDHQHKRGTPTMGGLAILAAALLGYLVPHAFLSRVTFSKQAIWMFLGILVMAALGFLDDYLKVRRQHNRGVLWKLKGYITIGMSALIAVPLVLVEHVNTRISFTRYDLPGWRVPTIVWIVLATATIFSTTNAVNVTDGLDGLAAGSAILGFLAFSLFAFWAFRNQDLYGVSPGLHGTINPLDLSIIAMSFAGACVGFLWWNAAPARIFMGDVGALGLGAALALLALTTNTMLMLPLICGLNVMEAGSVALQMAVFKASGRKKRLFRLSPVHHHFEKVGWPETTVIIRFWIISGICVALAIGIFYSDFSRLAGRG